MFVKVLSYHRGVSSPPVDLVLNVNQVVAFWGGSIRPDGVKEKPVVYLDTTQMKGVTIAGSVEDLLQVLERPMPESHELHLRQMKRADRDTGPSDQSVDSSRFVWVFEVMDAPLSNDKPWTFSKYIMTEYGTEWHSEARSMAAKEYGYTIRGGQRRKLTFEEYCAVLRCNNDGEHNQRVYQAMLRIVFNGSLFQKGQ
jgi:hypothetical protein